MSTKLYGIDVSKYQGTIDWNRVKAAGKEFVFVRVGWCGYDGRIAGNNGLDSRFRANVQGALDAGLHVGVYVYSYATTAAAARVAALETLSLVADYDITYPIVFDMEDTQTAKYNQNTKAVNSAIAKSFLDTVAEGGYTPLLYTYKSFAESYLDMQPLAGYDFWLAQYAAAPTYAGAYTIWQYTGSGSVDGISGAVDLNIAYKDYAAAGTEEPDTGDEGSAETPGTETPGTVEPEQPTAETFWSKLLQRLHETFRQNK